MRIVHVNYDYGSAGIGGAGVAASRLHRSMLAAGLDSVFLCTFKRESGEGVVEVPQENILRSLLFCGRRLLRYVLRLYGSNKSLLVNLIPSGVARRINMIKPDAVVIHWVAIDCLTFNEIAAIKAPLFCYLHDFWLLAGNEHHFVKGERKYIEGYNSYNSGYWDRFLWERKKRLFEKRSDICFVAPSQWATGVAKESLIGSRHKCFAIPNPIEDDVFHFDIGKAHNSRPFVILFGAYGGRNNNYKGFSDLVAALEMIPVEYVNSFCVKVFGEEAAPYLINGIKVTFLGKLVSEKDVVAAYHAADVFAFPSRQETQGQAKTEAMACGLPVVAFERTACAEGIVHKATGWLASDGDIAAFRDGLLWWFEQSLRDDWLNIRLKISATAHLAYGRMAIMDRWNKILDQIGVVS